MKKLISAIFFCSVAFFYVAGSNVSNNDRYATIMHSVMSSPPDTLIWPNPNPWANTDNLYFGKAYKNIYDRTFAFSIDTLIWPNPYTWANTDNSYIGLELYNIYLRTFPHGSTPSGPAGSVFGHGGYPYITTWLNDTTLTYSPGLYWDTAGIFDGFPVFNVSGIGSDSSGAQFNVATNNGDYMQFANNQIVVQAGTGGDGYYFNVRDANNTYINYGPGNPFLSPTAFGLNVNTDQSRISLGLLNNASENYFSIDKDSLFYGLSIFDINKVPYAWPSHNTGVQSYMFNDGDGNLSWKPRTSIIFTAYPPQAYIAYGGKTTDSMSYQHEGGFFYNEYYNLAGAPSLYPKFHIGIGKAFINFDVVDSTPFNSGLDNYIFSTGEFQFWTGSTAVSWWFPTTPGNSGDVLTKGSGAQTIWASTGAAAFATQRVAITGIAQAVTCTSGKQVLTLILTYSGGPGTVGTITLPTTPVDGQEVKISSAATGILLANISPTPIVNSASTNLTNTFIDLVYNASGTTWYQVQ